MDSNLVDKSELCRTVAGKLDKSIVNVTTVVDCALKTIIDTVSTGTTVRLKGFGKFESRFRPSRKVVSPQTGKSYQTAEKRVPFFFAGMPFKRSVKQSSHRTK